MVFNEVKESKGRTTLAENTIRQPINSQGKRHAVRLMSDLYGKGIVRGQVENINLKAYYKKPNVTSAEAIMTCYASTFHGKN